MNVCVYCVYCCCCCCLSNKVIAIVVVAVIGPRNIQYTVCIFVGGGKQRAGRVFLQVFCVLLALEINSFFFVVVFVFRWVLCLAVADSVFFDLYVAVLFAEPRC